MMTTKPDEGKSMVTMQGEIKQSGTSRGGERQQLCLCVLCIVIVKGGH
jgi:hypothetical protein